ncbi:MAG: DUF2878 domain-containing protein [Casimicrobiaceae bacterium]
MTTQTPHGPMALAINVVLFQFGWFACVLGAARGTPWLGPVVVAAIVGWHLARATFPGRELALIASAALAGVLFETLLVRAGWVRFDGRTIATGMGPYWMVALWALFATTLNVSLRALHRRPVLALLLGAIGGPAAYYGGARLGALDLVELQAALLALAVGWGLITPLLVALARRLDGYAGASA